MSLKREKKKKPEAIWSFLMLFMAHCVSGKSKPRFIYHCSPIEFTETCSEAYSQERSNLGFRALSCLPRSLSSRSERWQASVPRYCELHGAVGLSLGFLCWWEFWQDTCKPSSGPGFMFCQLSCNYIFRIYLFPVQAF